jgi:hypothetical protein
MPKISDEAVATKTGKVWKEWFALLDRGGAKEMSHHDIATLLYEKHKCPGWWAQMITVEYERARGLREKYETADGYAASSSKTVAVSLSRAYKAWADATVRRRWMGKTSFEVTKAKTNKSLRLRWNGGKNRVSVMFYPKGRDKSQVTIDHTRLANQAEVAATKSYWGDRLERFKKLVEV